MLSINKILLNYQKHPMGLVELPEISWSITADQRDTLQEAYVLQLSNRSSFSKILYETDWVASSASAQIELPSEQISLESAKKYFLRVRIKDNHHEISEWSLPTYFVTGILSQDEWQADFISGETIADKEESQSTLLRDSFKLDKPVDEAYAFLTAQGLYTAYLNGQKIGRGEMTPGWTSYNKRLLYQTYDVTALLQAGENIFGTTVGAGWYKGKMGFLGLRNNYGQRTAFMGQIVIRYTDGTQQVLGTSEEWLAHDGPVLFSEIYDGEIYDARLERSEWLACEPIEAYQDWRNAEVVSVKKNILYPQTGSLPCVNDRLPVKQIITTPQGDTVLDFGQNLTGWIEFKVKAPAGSQVVLECFEVLDKNGNVYQENLREAKEKIVYYTKGSELETYRPGFTFQGFRYAKVTAYPGKINAQNFTAEVVHSELETTGHFECDNPLLNQLQHNILWSLKGNFLDIPTDCPQRNERMGWTGDAQIFCRTANFLVDAYTFFSKWLQDVSADQLPEGGVPHIVPDIVTGNEDSDWLLRQGTHSAAAWADVAVVAPWTLYLTYGDQRILRQQFNSMHRWIDFMRDHAENYIWNYKLQFGDWVALDAEEGSYFGATPNDLTCTAYFAFSTQLFAKTCEVLGKSELAEEYFKLYDNIVETYRKTFFTENGVLTVKTQTAHIISLYFDLIPDEWKPKTADALVELLAEHDGHLVTGFVGTPYFCHALSDNGHVEEAYDLLLKEDFPSWLYQVKAGATTIWEHWDGIKPDGSMWSPDMNSFNHYAYGAIGEWLYRKMAGIEIDETHPGYRHTILQPLVSKRFKYVEGSYESNYGVISVRWEILEEDQVRIRVEVPANTTATLNLLNGGEILNADGIKFAKVLEGQTAEIGSGNYDVTYTLDQRVSKKNGVSKAAEHGTSAAARA